MAVILLLFSCQITIAYRDSIAGLGIEVKEIVGSGAIRFP